MATMNAVVHKSGDWVYPDGYPCGATAETWDKFAQADGKPFRRFQIPFADQDPLDAEANAYLVEVGHEIEILERDSKDIPFEVKRLLDAAKLHVSPESLATVKEFLATQSGDALPKLADFITFAKAKHHKEGGDITLTGNGGLVAPQAE